MPQSYFLLVENSKIKIPADFEMIDIVKKRPRDWQVSWFIAKVAGVVVRIILTSRCSSCLFNFMDSRIHQLILFE